MEYNPIKILTEAIRKVPFVKYALAIAGVASAIAIIKSFNIESNGNFPVVSILLMFSFMILLFVFSSFTKSQVPIVKYSGYALVFSTVLIFIFTSLLFVLAVFYDYPKKPNEIFNNNKSTILIFKPSHTKKGLVKKIGGGKYCEFEITFEILNANINFNENENEIIDSQVDCSYMEKPLSCEVSQKMNSHKYVQSEYKIINDSVIIYFAGDIGNVPKCDLIFKGTKTHNQISGVYTWVRSDDGSVPEVQFKIEIHHLLNLSEI